MLDGRLADFRRYSQQAEYLGEALGNPDAHAIRHVDGAVAQLLLGHLDEATEGLTLGLANLAIARFVTDPFRAWIAAEAGHLDEAVRLLADLGCPSLDWLPVNYCRLLLLAVLSETCATVGDRGLAAVLYPALLPFADRVAFAQISALGPVTHCLGGLAAVLGADDDADRHFGAAIEFAEGTGARGLLIRTHLGWARALAARGNLTKAHEQATAALKLAGELDAPGLGDRAAALLSGES
jgi:hypothetical protein